MNPKLYEVLEVLSDVPYINAGGCGISALTIYRWLKDNKKRVRSRCFVTLYRSQEAAQQNRRAVRSNDLQSLKVPTHICIIYNGKIIDSNGFATYDSYNRGPDLTESELLFMINYSDNWNETFDRTWGKEIIESKIGIDLSDVNDYCFNND